MTYLQMMGAMCSLLGWGGLKKFKGPMDGWMEW